MKKKLIVVIFMVSFLLVGTLPAVADSADDYKVVKKATKNPTGSEVTWFRIEVTDKATNKAKVKIKLPVSLIEVLADCTEEEFKIGGKNKINLKKILHELKKSGPMTLIEVDEKDAHVKIWFE